VVIRDGTGYLETVVELTAAGEETFSAVKDCGIESVVEFTGTLKAHFKKVGAYELQVTDATILNVAKDYPLGQKDHGVEFLFDNRHLHLRSQSQWAIQRVRDTIIHATYDWMRDHTYTKIDSPIFTPTCAEDSTELYEVTHTNGEQMFLSQTGQMYIEAAIAGHRNVYDF
jgi:asparaginyl-tRNA synthetase